MREPTPQPAPPTGPTGGGVPSRTAREDLDAVLRVLSDLAPAPRAPAVEVADRTLAPIAWVGAFEGVVPPFAPSAGLEPGVPTAEGFRVGRSPASGRLDTLDRYDAINPQADDLRIGWLWVTGRCRVGDRVRDVRLPMLSAPVSVSSGRFGLGGHTLTVNGPWDLWSLVENGDTADLEDRAPFGGGRIGPDTTIAAIASDHDLVTWVGEVLERSDLPEAELAPPSSDPVEAVPPKEGETGLVVHVGYGVYVAEVVDLARPRLTIPTWIGQPDVDRSAFASLYLSGIGDLDPPASQPAPPHDPFADPSAAPTDRTDPGAVRPVPAVDAPVVSPLPLNAVQREIVRRARHEPLVAVSGPPGTGKTQAAVAVALDTIAAGGSVLMATRSGAAARSITALLDRVPTPTPIQFAARRGGMPTFYDAIDDVDPSALTDLGSVTRAERRLHDAIVEDLADVRAAEDWEDERLALTVTAPLAPALFGPDGDRVVDEAAPLLRAATTDARGFFASRRRRRALRRLRKLLGAGPDASVEDLIDALRVAEIRRRAHRLENRDPVLAADRMAAWADRHDAHGLAWSRHLDARVRSEVSAGGRRAIGELAAALRGGSATRRGFLQSVDVRALTGALPLWIGTLDEIEAMLPARAAVFDLVILDEASQIDQVSAAAALLRARRAVIIGDPKQLRFVSFLSDGQIARAIADHDAAHLGRRLDVRRTSTFDLAESAARVSTLDEHFRSVPHLIGFSAERFYGEALAVATRHPRNDSKRAIELRQVAGTRDGHNATEVDTALGVALEICEEDPDASVTIISPFRDQIDAIEDRGATLFRDRTPPRNLRWGTVHGVQGGECDVAVISLSVSDPGDRALRFVEDPNLFNVMVSRARHRIVLLSSLREPRPGLLADYLTWLRRPPDENRGRGSTHSDHPWTAELAAVLIDLGVPFRCDYEVGRWSVDLVVGEGSEAIAVATRLHPAGSYVHLDRHLALHRAGWRQRDAFAGTGEAVPVALALAELVGGPTP